MQSTQLLFGREQDDVNEILNKERKTFVASHGTLASGNGTEEDWEICSAFNEYMFEVQQQQGIDYPGLNDRRGAGLEGQQIIKLDDDNDYDNNSSDEGQEEKEKEKEKFVINNKNPKTQNNQDEHATDNHSDLDHLIEHRKRSYVNPDVYDFQQQLQQWQQQQQQQQNQASFSQKIKIQINDQIKDDLDEEEVDQEELKIRERSPCISSERSSLSNGFEEALEIIYEESKMNDKYKENKVKLNDKNKQ